MAENRQCTVIVAYEMTHEDCERFMDSWEKANEYVKKQPGFVSTTLHRAVSANPDFRFVDIGCWESDDAFRKATQSQEFREVSTRLMPFNIHASAYEVVRN